MGVLKITSSYFLSRKSFAMLAEDQAAHPPLFSVFVNEDKSMA
jgi:hypothetical protein